MTSYDYLSKLGCFTRKEILKYAGSGKKADSVLSYLKKHELLISVKRNLYVVVSKLTKLPLASHYEVASKITKSSFISHHSAFEYYGMANQVFNDVNVSSSTRFNNFEFDGRSYKFIESKISKGIVRNEKISVTDIERTIIDSIKDFLKIGGLEELLRCLEMVTFIDEKKILTYLSAYNNQSLYQKAGFILSHYKESMKISDSFFRKCKKKIKKSVRYLYTDIDDDQIFYSQWKLYAPKNLMKIIE